MTRALSLTERDVDVARGMRRRELFAWIAAALAVNMYVAQVDLSSLGAVLARLADFNVVFLVAWVAVAKRLLASTADAPADGWDAAFAVSFSLGLCLASIFPTTIALSVLATATALYLGFRHGRDAELRAAAAVVGALSVNTLWGPVFFNLFALELLRADAALVGTAYAMTRPEVTWFDTTIGAPGGHSIVVGSGCSSFHNISLALLAWVSLTTLRRAHWVRGDAWVALAAVAAMVLLNAVRLYLMGWSPEGYEYWHNGVGSDVFGAVTMLAVIAIGWGGARWAEAAA